MALLFGMTLLVRAGNAFGQEPERGSRFSASRAGPLFHPDGPGPLRWRASVGVLVDILPRRVVESEVREIPQLTGNFRLGLPHGFSTDIRASANVIGNQGALGVAWSHRLGDFSFSVLDHQGVWFGFVGL